MDDRIWLSPPHLSGYEDDFLKQAFNSNWVAPMGPNITGFEDDLELFLGHNSNVLALNSGTSAIHLALILLGVKRDDEVICQSHTFIASANPILYQGAIPVFVDSESETWNMCPEILETAIKDRLKVGKKPKAILTVCSYGMPYHVSAIHDIAKRYQIPVIEDSSEALGSLYGGIPCGNFGEYSILSFNGNKIITTSGGGALICRTKQTKDKALFLATQAKDDGLDYNHPELGYNYRISNISAGIGRGQMKVLEKRVQARRQVFEYYYKRLHLVKDLEFLLEPEGFFSNRWLTCILTPCETSKNELLNLITTRNIDVRPLWKPLHSQELYKSYPSYLNGTSENLHQRGLCLPSGSNLTLTQLDVIINYILNYFGYA